MKTLVLITLSILLSLSTSHATDAVLTKKIGEIITEVDSIKVDGTRADLEKLFRSDGGISPLSQTTYVLKRCPYIKIDIQFRLVTQKKELKGDVILKVFKPYLATPFYD